MASSAKSRWSVSRLARGARNRTARALGAVSARLRRLRTPRLLKEYDRLHLGSGGRLLDGWANVDINGLGNLVWDLTKPLPIPPGRVRFVYSEHFIEHIPHAAARRLLGHARRVMAADGVIRISTPDLKPLVDDYQAGRLVRMDHADWRPATLCQMVNEAMRNWGHVFIYDEAELTALLRECGFNDVRRVKRGESEFPELRGLESRPDFGDLILEARV
ncbi:MAG TPA: methyltransferase domain-containing protein [Allosphingosinicella sp.]|jgi:predicted SAM-dependent methyltransferase